MSGSQIFIWVVAIAGLVLITALSRSFFFLLPASIKLPSWIEKGLKYAPLAALAAVITPDVLLTQGQWHGNWMDAKLIAAVVAMCFAAWRRDMLETILVGMAVFLPLKLMLGW
jgi:branched-subunit amino acid transport protein